MSDATLVTSRLTLIACVPAQLLALIESVPAFAQATGRAVEPGLREMFVSDEVSPDWLEQLQLDNEPDPWRRGFFILDRVTDAAIGTAGFKGPPDKNGIVEIAYGIVPGRENQGLATEAAGALVRFALADPRVQLIRAHTLLTSAASMRVLAKSGFTRVEDVVDPDDGPVSRWERKR